MLVVAFSDPGVIISPEYRALKFSEDEKKRKENKTTEIEEEEEKHGDDDSEIL